MTMASILEKESTKSDENKLIASVFLNRLAQGMKLQTDPSANYAADKLTGAPTQVELSLNSPYNTYVVIGLPPGPISSVGATSYEAVFKYHFQSGLFLDSDHDCDFLAFPVRADSTVPHIHPFKDC